MDKLKKELESISSVIDYLILHLYTATNNELSIDLKNSYNQMIDDYLKKRKTTIREISNNFLNEDMIKRGE